MSDTFGREDKKLGNYFNLLLTVTTCLICHLIVPVLSYQQL